MIPLIFISSTVEDLHHLRDAVRDTVEEIGYTPIMSEYGDIGYLPRSSAEDSCYQSLTDCQLAVLIIGKRYGSLSKTGFSVTQNEFRTAKANEMPLVTLIDQEVLSFKRVYDAHSEDQKPKCFPGMESPDKTFSFIREVMESPSNNGILPFSNVADARTHFKKQLAHIFGDLLRNQHNVLTTSVRDVLSEIKTLRHELSGGRPPDSRYLRTIRVLIDEPNRQLRELIEQVSGPIDTAVPLIYEAESFTEFLQNVGHALQIIQLPREDESGETFFKMFDKQMKFKCAFIIQHPTKGEKINIGHWAITEDREVLLTQITFDYFNMRYEKIKKTTLVVQQDQSALSVETSES